MRSLVSSVLVLAAAASAGLMHPSACFKKNAHRTEVVTSPRPHEYLAPSALPTDFDWRVQLQSKGAQISAPRNQHIPHYCGACWAFAATSSLSDRIRILQNGNWPEVNIAPQLILDCDTYDDACYGGDPTTAFQFLHENNATDETCNIYVAAGYYKTGRKCTAESYCYTCSPTNGKCSPVSNYITYHVEQYGSVAGEANMMAEIYARGPITCGVAVTAGFEDYTGGIFQDPTGATDIGHSISVVGWGVDASTNTPYWIGRNSWGNFWGEQQGFFRILRGAPNGQGNLCIECDCQWGVPANFTPPTPPPVASSVDDSTSLAQIAVQVDAVMKQTGENPYALRLSAPVADNLPPRVYLREGEVCRVANSSFKHGPVITEPLPHTYLAPEALPAVWDWRNVNGTRFTTWNKNQHIPQYCGSCWAQASTSALSDRISILLKNPAVAQINLSPQVIINCEAGGDCGGGDPAGVYEFGHTHGIPDQTCQQYVAEDGSGNCLPAEVCETCHPTNSSFSPGACDAITTYPIWKVGDYGSVQGVNQMKAEIYARGPIDCGIEATAKFEVYTGGIFSEAVRNPMINHEISIVGWGLDTSSNTPYWVGRNSWGTAWGMEGWFYLKLGVNELGVESGCNWGVPIVTAEHRAAFAL